VSKRKIPEILTESEQNRLLEVFNTRYLSPHRNKTMIKLMLDTGLRLSEIINLKWQHVNLQTGKLKVVNGKGKKDRVVWFNNGTLELVREWRERQAKDIGQCEYTFTTKAGNKLKQRDVRSMVYTYTEKAKINKDVSPHTFRHTYATDLYQETKNIRLVQKSLGHSDLSTTMIYTHIVDEEMERAHKNFRNR